MVKGNRTKNQEWLRKLRDIPVTNAVNTSNQRLVSLAAQLTCNNSVNEAIVYALFMNINQSVKQSYAFKKRTDMFWKVIWERDPSQNDKAMWIAELKADQ